MEFATTENGDRKINLFLNADDRKKELVLSVIRVEKTKNYTVMSNAHLRDKGLSLKAMGIMSFMLSLPDDWDYTVAGLATCVKDGVDSVRSALRELEDKRYLTIIQSRQGGKFSSNDYRLSEIPFTENPFTENPLAVNPLAEKRPQRSTKEISTKEISTKEEKKEPAKGQTPDKCPDRNPNKTEISSSSSLPPAIDEIKRAFEKEFHPIFKTTELDALSAYIDDYGRMGVLKAIETAGKRKNLNKATLSPRYLLPILQQLTQEKNETPVVAQPSVSADISAEQQKARILAADKARMKKIQEVDEYGVYGGLTQ